MAEGILSRLSAGAKEGASQGFESALEGRPEAGGIVGSMFRGAIGNLLNTAKENKGGKESEQLADTADQLSEKLNPIIPFFANITENVQLIAYHIGASITTMKDIKTDSKQSFEKAARAQEEAATEDAVLAPPPTPEQQEDACPCDEEGNKKEDKEKDDEAGGFLKQFGGMDFEGIVGSFGSIIGEALFDLGFTVITKLFPVGLIVSLVAAVGYGVYKYFTDEEFQKTVDDAFNTAKQFVIENVFDPFINGVKKLVTGAIEFLGNFWEAVKGAISRAYEYVSEKASQAKKAVVSGAKSVGSKIASKLGFGGGEKAAPPPPPPAAPPAPPKSTGGTVSVPPKEASGAPSAPTAQPSAAPTAAATPAPAPAAAPAAATPAPTAGGTATGDASKLDSVVNKASGVDLSGIVPALKARMAGFAAEFQALTGKKILVTSGFRSPEKQRELYAKDPVHAAKPGLSPHEIGTAFDANSKSGDLDKAEQLGLFAKYRLFRPLWPPHRTGGVMEAWHVEPLERMKIASVGDGGIVAGSSGAALDPGSGKPTPVPPQPDKGKGLSTASTTNAAINEKRTRDAGAKTVVVNAPTTNVQLNKMNPVIANAEPEPVVRMR